MPCESGAVMLADSRYKPTRGPAAGLAATPACYASGQNYHFDSPVPMAWASEPMGAGALSAAAYIHPRPTGKPRGRCGVSG
jgi:hypothetical protein